MRGRLHARLRAALYRLPAPPNPFDAYYREAAATHRPVLDFGAGRGKGLRRIAPRESFVVGADVGPQIRENSTVDARVVFDGNRLPFRNATFGLCTMRWVVEHLPDPAATFSEVARVLRPGGRLVILTSNLWFYGYLAARLIPNWAHGWIVRRVSGRSERDTFPTHYRANTRRRLRTLLGRAGFRERALVGFQHGVGYLDFWAPTFLLGAVYDRMVNLTPALQGMRQGLIADFERT